MSWVDERNSEEIGRRVVDSDGNAGEIVGGSIETGRWIVRLDDDGTEREYEGPQLYGRD